MSTVVTLRRHAFGHCDHMQMLLLCRAGFVARHVLKRLFGDVKAAKQVVLYARYILIYPHNDMMAIVKGCNLMNSLWQCFKL